MAIVPQSQARTGTYVPTTFIFDVISQLKSIDVTSEEFKELLIRSYENIGLMCTVLNLKETGYYLQQELINSQKWFPNPALTENTPQRATFRQDYRTVVFFPALPATAATVTEAHGVSITNQFTFTRCDGIATNQSAVGTGNPIALSIPYSSATTIADQLEIWVDDTNVNIKSGGKDYSDFFAVVVLEFLKL